MVRKVAVVSSCSLDGALRRLVTVREPHVIVLFNVAMNKDEAALEEADDVFVWQGHAPQALQRASSIAADIAEGLQQEDRLTALLSLPLGSA